MSINGEGLNNSALTLPEFPNSPRGQDSVYKFSSGATLSKRPIHMYTGLTRQTYSSCLISFYGVLQNNLYLYNQDWKTFLPPLIIVRSMKGKGIFCFVKYRNKGRRTSNFLPMYLKYVMYIGL